MKSQGSMRKRKIVLRVVRVSGGGMALVGTVGFLVRR